MSIKGNSFKAIRFSAVNNSTSLINLTNIWPLVEKRKMSLTYEFLTLKKIFICNYNFLIIFLQLDL